MRLAQRPGRRLLSTVTFWVIVAVTTRALFWLVTDRTWEDALITAQHAVNFARGEGLAHHPGEGPVHGFTSVFSLLIPLLGEVAFPGSAVTAQKVASLVAAAFTIVVADRLGRQLGLSALGRTVVLGYLALDYNQIFYGMAGLETQFAVLAILTSASLLVARSRFTGLALGASVLVRPDFAIWVALVAGWVVVFHRRGVGAVFAGLMAITVPWLAFAWAYFGSPVPHTVSAKAAALLPPPSGSSILDVGIWVYERVTLNIVPSLRMLSPFLEDSLVASAPVPTPALLAVGLLVYGLAALGIHARIRDPRWLPLVAFVIAYLGYRLIFLPPVYFDWYAPPYAACLIIVAAGGLQRLAAPAPVTRSLSVAVVIAFAIHLPLSYALDARIQREIEQGVRVPMAQFLRDAVGPGEAVASEAAGYIGYYAGVLLYDYPGLTSPTALDAVRSVAAEERGLSAMIDRLRPAWIVVRPDELADLQRRYPETAARYEVARRFGDGAPTIAVDGLVKYTIDRSFLVMRAGQ